MKYLALIIFGMFCILSSYSYGRYVYQPPMKTVWANHNAEQLAGAYGLTPDDVSAPIEIWRKQ